MQRELGPYKAADGKHLSKKFTKRKTLYTFTDTGYRNR